LPEVRESVFAVAPTPSALIVRGCESVFATLAVNRLGVNINQCEFFFVTFVPFCG